MFLKLKLIFWVFLVAIILNPVSADAATPPVSAESYYRWLQGAISDLERQMPVIIRSAEAAAKAYVEDGHEIAIYGDLGLMGEAECRAGGLIGMRVNEGAYPHWKGIVLLFPSYKNRGKDLASAATFLKQSKMVVAFGSRSFMEEAAQTGIVFNAFIETRKVSTDGVFEVGGKRVIPTSPVPDIVALWVWTGEFIAACTRKGKMPPIYQSWVIPGANERTDKYRKIKFHAEKPEPIVAGKVGLAYLREIKGGLKNLYDCEEGPIRTVALKAVDTIKKGRCAYLSPYGHAIIQHITLPCDPGYFKPVNDGWAELRKDVHFAKGDFVFCVGYDGIQTNIVRMAREANADLAWSFTDYNKDPLAGVPAIGTNALYINQHWPLGDAVVPVPGYDVKILPISSVISEACLWMVEAEMVRLLPPSP